MEQLLDILVNYGPWGMFIAAFLAGSILPSSSETVRIALLAVGLNPWALLRKLVQRWGPLMGLFCWLPFLGDAILVTLGIMRSNPLLTNIMMILGRTLRYATVLLSALGIASLLA